MQTSGYEKKECLKILHQMPKMPIENRISAVETLLRNADMSIRLQAIRMGAAIVNEDRLIGYLRNRSDHALRNAGNEMLKILGAQKGIPIALKLLKDDDQEIVLSAIAALDYYKDMSTVDVLRSQLRHPKTNIVSAAIVALGHSKDVTVCRDLVPFLKFEKDVRDVAIQALGDLGSVQAVQPLGMLLANPEVAPLAFEALARIGGGKAFSLLCDFWLKAGKGITKAIAIPNLANAAESLLRSPVIVDVMKPEMAKYLEDKDDQIQLAAARCILAMGESDADKKCLEIILPHYTDPSTLPLCLSKRYDLIVHLLAQKGVAKAWGFLLSARFPEKAPLQEFIKALKTINGLEFIDSVFLAVSKFKDVRLAEPLLDFYLTLPDSHRIAWVPILLIYKHQIAESLSKRKNIDKETKLILDSFINQKTFDSVANIAALPKDNRVKVIKNLSNRKHLLRELPWKDWIESCGSIYAALAAEVAVKAQMKELLPVLRENLDSAVMPEVIGAISKLKDLESVPALIAHLNNATHFEKVLILEGLGLIGGTDARITLKKHLGDKDHDIVRLAYRALAHCAEREDVPIFTDASDHDDWYIRLASAEVLGKFQNDENCQILNKLNCDPVTIVANTAKMALKNN